MTFVLVLNKNIIYFYSRKSISSSKSQLMKRLLFQVNRNVSRDFWVKDKSDPKGKEKFGCQITCLVSFYWLRKRDWENSYTVHQGFHGWHSTTNLTLSGLQVNTKVGDDLIDHWAHGQLAHRRALFLINLCVCVLCIYK